MRPATTLGWCAATFGLLLLWACDGSVSSSSEPDGGTDAHVSLPDATPDTCTDEDGDGFGIGCANGGDCNDADPNLASGCPVTFAWDVPTTRTDGTVLSDALTYRLYWGSDAAGYMNQVDVSGLTCVDAGAVTTCSFTTAEITPGVYYFAVTAVDENGRESPMSAPLQHTVY